MASPVSSQDPAHYDTVICGGGLAALTMARQILRRRPGKSVLILDRASVPSPVASHKVGESVPEGAAYYYRTVLGLEDYLSAAHIPKFGLRFFYGGGATPLEDRLEYGGVNWPPIATYQLDRGMLENDLRRMVVDGGATLLSETRVTDVALNENGGPHRVEARRDGKPFTVTARWLIDASGRARVIAKKRGLTEKVPHRVSVCWWRTDRHVKVDDFVSADNLEWHGRVGPPRWHSTCHLAGDGYWVWLIPLASGKTSIGIIADEDKHPLRSRRNHDQAMAWCREREPQLADALADVPVLDFQTMKNFAYTTAQAFSHHRWACIGDSGVLTDALYSFGQEIMAHAELIAMRLMRLDDAGELTEETAQQHDTLYRDLFAVAQTQYTGMYDVFGHSFAATQKLAWDSSMYFALFQQVMLQDCYEHPDAMAFLSAALRRLAPLNQRMQEFFLDTSRIEDLRQADKGMRTWAPRVGELADASVRKQPFAGLAGFLEKRLDALEEIATVIFGEVVRRDPLLSDEERNEVLSGDTGIAPAAIGVQPDRWREDGLFQPDREPVDFTSPAQFDVRQAHQKSRASFATVGGRLRRTAHEHPDRPALIELSAGGRPGETLSYRELLDRVERVQAVVERAPGRTIGVCGRPLETVPALFAVLGCGRTAVPVSPSEGRAALQAAAEQCGFTSTFRGDRLVNTSTTSVTGSSCPSWHPATSQATLTDWRLTGWGPQVVRLDDDALHRMHTWLNRLLVNGTAGTRDPAGLHCLWFGAPRPELLLLLTLGHRITLVPSAGAGTAPRADVLLAAPEDLRALSATGRIPRSAQVFSVGRPLPPDLALVLREQTGCLYDFAYLSFSH